MKNSFDRIEIHLVDHCNLNCKSCYHYCPLVTEPWYYSIDQYRQDLIQLHNYMAPESSINLMGGEPLLHPAFLELCKITREIFPFAEIRVWTNGLLLKEKSKEFFDFLNNINVYLWLDDYYNDALLRTKVKMFAVDPIIDRNELAPFNNCGIDLINKHEYTNQEMYNRCTLDQACLFIQMKSGGILYKCPQEAYNNYLEDYFDLKFPKDYVKLSLDIYNTNQAEVLDFINTGSNFCEYCNRIFDNHTEDSISQNRLSRRELSEWVKNY